MARGGKKMEIIRVRGELVGSARGRAKIHVHIFSSYAFLGGKRWRLIYIHRRPFDSATSCRDFFADSCDSIGEFTDIHQ